MTQAYGLKGMRSTGDFDAMWEQNDWSDQAASTLAHQSLLHVYPRGEIQIEFVEKADAYWLMAELPDIKQDDITVQVDNGHLSIQGKWPEEFAAGGTSLLIEGRRAFARWFHLDEPVETDAMSMTYTDGVLAVRVPKLVSAQEDVLEDMLVAS